MGDNFKVSASWAHKFSLAFHKGKMLEIFLLKVGSDTVHSDFMAENHSLINQVSIVNPPNFDVKSHQKTSTYESHKKFSFTSTGSKSMCETVLTLKWAIFNNNIWWSIQIFQGIYSKNHKPAGKKMHTWWLSMGSTMCFMKTTHKASVPLLFEEMRNRSEQLDDLITESFEFVRRYSNPLQPLSYIHLYHTTRKTIVDFHLFSQIEFVRVHCSYGWKKLLECLAYPEMKFIQESLNSQFAWEEQKRKKKL